MKSKVRTAPDLKLLKRASKSFEAIQQSFILALLNQANFGFRIRVPERRSIKTLQTFVVEDIILPDSMVFHIHDEIEKKCAELVQGELNLLGYVHCSPENLDSLTSIYQIAQLGYNMEKLKTIKRHREANRNSLGFNWILDVAENTGFSFTKRSSKPATYTIKMMKITSVKFDKNIMKAKKNEIKKEIVEFKQNEIEIIGEKINYYICSKFDEYENGFGKLINKEQMKLDEKEDEIITIYPCDPKIVEIFENFSTTPQSETFLKSIFGQIHSQMNETIQQVEEDGNDENDNERDDIEIEKEISNANETNVMNDQFDQYNYQDIQNENSMIQNDIFVENMNENIYDTQMKNNEVKYENTSDDMSKRNYEDNGSVQDGYCEITIEEKELLNQIQEYYKNYKIYYEYYGGAGFIQTDGFYI